MTTENKALRTKQGVVVSDKMDKTITVLIERKEKYMSMMKTIVLRWEIK